MLFSIVPSRNFSYSQDVVWGASFLLIWFAMDARGRKRKSDPTGVAGDFIFSLHKKEPGQADPLEVVLGGSSITTEMRARLWCLPSEWKIKEDLIGASWDYRTLGSTNKENIANRERDWERQLISCRNLTNYVSHRVPTPTPMRGLGSGAMWLDQFRSESKFKMSKVQQTCALIVLFSK